MLYFLNAFAISNVPIVSMLAATIGVPVYSTFECLNLNVLERSPSSDLLPIVERFGINSTSQKSNFTSSLIVVISLLLLILPFYDQILLQFLQEEQFYELDQPAVHQISNDTCSLFYLVQHHCTIQVTYHLRAILYSFRDRSLYQVVSFVLLATLTLLVDSFVLDLRISFYFLRRMKVLRYKYFKMNVVVPTITIVTSIVLICSLKAYSHIFLNIRLSIFRKYQSIATIILFYQILYIHNITSSFLFQVERIQSLILCP